MYRRGSVISLWWFRRTLLPSISQKYWCIYIYTHTHIYIYIYIYTFFATNVLDTEICDTDSRCLFVHTLVCVLPYPHIPFKVQYYNE